MRLASDAYLSDLRFRIYYFVPHPDQNLEEASPFQGATMGMVETAQLLEEVMLQPADARELTAPWSSVAFLRASGLITHKILPIEYSAFKEILTWPNLSPFRCVISSAENVDFVDSCLPQYRDTWLHLSAQPGEGRYQLDNLRREVFRDYIKQRTDQLDGDVEYGSIANVVRPLLQGNLPASRRISLPSSMHNLTRPNEIGLMAFGCRLADGIESPRTDSKAAYWISRSVDFVNRQRRELIPTAQQPHIVNALLLTLPSIYRGRRKQEIVRRFRKVDWVGKMPRGRLVRDFLNPRSYLWHVEENELHEFVNSALGNALLAIRRDELNLYTAILTRLSAESLLPAMRLSPKSNNAWGHLKQLADCVRSEGPNKRRKISRLLAVSQTELESGLDDRFNGKLQFISNQVQGIKLACELPLEWVRVNGVPLMLRHECSRVPTVPSSLGYATATNQDPLFILPSQLTDILVIRSFSADDHIRTTLERAVELILKQECAWKVNVRFVDVDTTEQIVEALNNHAGAIVVFDCHGRFEQDEYLSSLVIGGIPVRLWEIRKQIERMPPIVLLSACDTLPVDGSHASVALSMLQLGARTVLATLLPIDANKAAIFLARLIYRIGEFVPLSTKTRLRISWREIVAGMIKMMHVTECLSHLESQGLLDHDGYRKLHLAANIDINNREPDWLEQCAAGLAAHIHCTKAEAMEYVICGTGLSDAMMHVQLGHPELIWLVGDQFGAIDQNVSVEGSF